MGAEMLAWGREALGVTINEFYGQTECNMVASSSAAMFDARPGAIGKAVPGFEVAVIDETGAKTEGEGDIAVRRGAASMMLEYWNKPKETREKFRGDWLITGDRGVIALGRMPRSWRAAWASRRSPGSRICRVRCVRVPW